jgi:hypothetical protein
MPGVNRLNSSSAMRSEPVGSGLQPWRHVPELLALFGLALTPVTSSLAMMPDQMTVTICTGGQTRTMTIEIRRNGPSRDDDCPRACHAICERRKIAGKRA